MGTVIQFPKPKAHRQRGLTMLQLKTLRFVEAHRLANGGGSPSMEAIARAVGLRSLSGTKRTIRSLIEAGALAWPGQAE